MVDLELDGLNAEQVRVLERPRELLARAAAEAAGEDVGDRLALGLFRARIEKEPERPRGTRLVVVVAAHEHGLHAGQIEIADAALLDDPRERPEALAVGRAPAGAAADAAARADRLAVAGLQVAPGDPPAHFAGIICAPVPASISIAGECEGTVSPGTLSGA